MPGRSIISGINSCTCNLSHFVDVFLPDYVRALLSYLIDSDSLIHILNTMIWEEGVQFLTMDVTVLYSYSTFITQKEQSAWQITSHNPFVSKIILYKRYIDDLFFLWEGDEKEALNFINHLNQNSWIITFNPNYGTTEVKFLDLLIFHN